MKWIFCLLLLLLGLLLFVPNIFSLKNGAITSTAFMRSDSSKIVQYWVPLEKISEPLKKAVIVAEDGNFYQHNGIDWFEVKESLFTNVDRGRFARGASTITMQLARNLYLSKEKSLTRKLLEVWIAWKMEHILSKNRILEIYLNVVEWGNGIYGVGAASRHYFGKSASQLGPMESAHLAAILPSPKKWGKHFQSENALQRRGIIARRMRRQH